MGRLFFLITLSMFLFTGLVFAYDDGDFQVWHKEKQVKKINDRFKIALEEEFKFGDNAREFYCHYYDAGVVMALNKYMDVGLNYRQVYKKKEGKFRDENRPHINVFLKAEWQGFEFEDRNRFLYRNFDTEKDYWVYANKFAIVLPWKFTKLFIQPYFEEEAFIDMKQGDYVENEFTAGLLASLAKNVSMEIYYLLQSGKDGDCWTDAKVLGTTLKVSF